MRVVNAYTVSPQDIRQGDIMLFVIKAVMVRPGVFRLYRCPFEGEGIPQGARVYYYEAEVVAALFPSLAQVASPDPLG